MYDRTTRLGGRGLSWSREVWTRREEVMAIATCKTGLARILPGGITVAIG
jgi:hypothetical protein